jgi:hypothetical protein
MKAARCFHLSKAESQGRQYDVLLSSPWHNRLNCYPLSRCCLGRKRGRASTALGAPTVRLLTVTPKVHSSCVNYSHRWHGPADLGNLNSTQHFRSKVDSFRGGFGWSRVSANYLGRRMFSSALSPALKSDLPDHDTNDFVGGVQTPSSRRDRGIARRKRQPFVIDSVIDIPSSDYQMYLDFYPRIDQNPVMQLNEYFLTNYGIVSVTKMIKVDRVHFDQVSGNGPTDSEGTECGWIGSFVHPITGEKYVSGSLPVGKSTFPRYMGGYLGVLDQGAVTPGVYKTIGAAKIATAARTLDLIQYSERMVESPRYCIDKVRVDPDSQQHRSTHQLSPIAVVAQHYRSNPASICLRNCGTREATHKDSEFEIFDYVTLQQVAMKNSPRRLYTASFLCPETGASFAAGTFPGASVVEVAPNVGSFSEVTPASELVRRTYYTKRTAAIQAAVAKAWDSREFRVRGSQFLRYCLEDPEPDPEQMLVGEQMDLTAMGNHSPFKYDSAAVVFESRSPSGVPPSDRVANASDSFDRDDGSSRRASQPDQSVGDLADDYVQWDIPTTGGSPPSERVLEALSKRRFTLTASPSNESGLLPLLLTPRQHLEIAIEAAHEWLAGVKPSVRDSASLRLELPTRWEQNCLEAGKILLSNLAASIQRVPRGSETVQAETVAKLVLDYLWSTSKSHPDTDSYNLYLLCLSGSINKLNAAKKGELIVKHMSNGTSLSGHGRGPLPARNNDTLNSLLFLWAQVGGLSGRYQPDDDIFTPTRDSFLNVLSSCTFEASVTGETGGFDKLFAQQCIDRMKELASAGPDAELFPDTAVYNAPLRRCGAPSRSRNFASVIPWDSYSTIYKDGFSDFRADEPTVTAAVAAQKWMEDMESAPDQCKPDVETFEAVVQAWARTGTKEGLEQAELIARRLLVEQPFAVRARLQTFHPILAGWLHSGSLEGARKVVDLIELLVTESAHQPLVTPDGRVLGWHLAAYSTELVLRRNLQGEHDLSQNDHFRISLANSCVTYLRIYVGRITAARLAGFESETLLESTAFIHAMSCWATIAEDSAGKGAFEQAIEGMESVLDQFEGLLRFLLELELSSNARKEEDANPLEPSRQLSHLVATSHTVYCSYIAELRRLEQKRFSSEKTAVAHVLRKRVSRVEQVVRRSGELVQLLQLDRELKLRRLKKPSLFPGDGFHHEESGSILRSMEYSDGFQYSLPASIQRLCQREFTVELAGYVKLSATSESIEPGDRVRAALALRRVLQSLPLSKRAHSTSRKAIDDVLTGASRDRAPLEALGACESIGGSREARCPRGPTGHGTRKRILRQRWSRRFGRGNGINRSRSRSLPANLVSARKEG